MPRVGEFCPSNIVRLLLTVVIFVTVLTAIGFWLDRIRQSKPTVDKCGCLAAQAAGVSSAMRWSGAFASPGRMSAR
jgi:hypothetical protein